MDHEPAHHRPAGADAVRTASITVDGVRSPLLTAGADDADEAAVFVHGNPGSAEDWRHLVAVTGTFARAVAPDMPGYGAADKPVDFPYTIEGYAHHLGRLLETAGIRTAHLVLHDLGGPWGLAWAADHPERVASVTLLNIGVLRGYRWHRAARIWRTRVAGGLFLRSVTLPAVRAVVARDNPRGLPDDVVRRLHRDLTDRGVQRTILRLYRATDLAVWSDALHDRLRDLDLPALVVWGARDRYVDVRHAQRQRESFPRAEVVVLDDSGHWPMLDDPVTVERLITRFLRERLAGPH